MSLPSEKCEAMLAGWNQNPPAKEAEYSWYEGEGVSERICNVDGSFKSCTCGRTFKAMELQKEAEVIRATTPDPEAEKLADIVISLMLLFWVCATVIVLLKRFWPKAWG